MKLVVIIIMLMVGFSFLLKLTYLPKFGRTPICLALAFFVGESWEYAAGQSKTQIADWLQNPELMLDISVLLTIDVFMQISFCMLEAKSIAGEKLSKSANFIRNACLWIPGILIFPTLIATLVEAIFAFTGIDFITIAWAMAALIIVVGLFAPMLLEWLIPEGDLRLELMFMINALIAMLGVIATVNGRTAVAGSNSAEWQPLLAFLVLLMVCAFAGFILFRRKTKKYSIGK